MAFTGHTKDYIAAQWSLLQQEVAEDFVIATGKTTTVREFVRLAFAYAGVSIQFSGEGISEIGTIESTDNDLEDCQQTTKCNNLLYEKWGAVRKSALDGHLSLRGSVLCGGVTRDNSTQRSDHF